MGILSIPAYQNALPCQFSLELNCKHSGSFVECADPLDCVTSFLLESMGSPLWVWCATGRALTLCRPTKGRTREAGRS